MAYPNPNSYVVPALDFFNLNEALQLLLLIGVLRFVGTRMGGDKATILLWARGLAAAGFLLYVGCGIDHWHPTRAGDFLALTVRALLAMGTVHSLARIALSVIFLLHKVLWMDPMVRLHLAEERNARRLAAVKAARDESERVRKLHEHLEDQRRRSQEEEAHRPLPPTFEELLAGAQQRYQSNVRVLSSAGLSGIELKSAQEKAKQNYLRELDQLLK